MIKHSTYFSKVRAVDERWYGNNQSATDRSPSELRPLSDVFSVADALSQSTTGQHASIWDDLVTSVDVWLQTVWHFAGENKYQQRAREREGGERVFRKDKTAGLLRTSVSPN